MRSAYRDAVPVRREGPPISGSRARTILFVCTGNTCRSPMAEAIGRHLLAQKGLSDSPVNMFSGGTGALEGAPATAEAMEALRRLNIEPQPHRSTGLTPEMVRGADAIYVMTRGHLEAVRGLAPDVLDRVELLDPEGRDIPDPLGYPQPVYDQVAQRIRDAIQRRLESRPSPADL